MKDGFKHHDLYARLFRFHKRHAGATTDEEWTACAEAIEEFKTPFEVDMAVAIVTEIEREYEAATGRKGI